MLGFERLKSRDSLVGISRKQIRRWANMSATSHEDLSKSDSADILTTGTAHCWNHEAEGDCTVGVDY